MMLKINSSAASVIPELTNAIEVIDAYKNLLSRKTGKHYLDGSDVFEGDTITAFKMPIGVVEWCDSNLQWNVRITKSPSGSMSIGSTKPLKEFFNPTKVR